MGAILNFLVNRYAILHIRSKSIPMHDTLDNTSIHLQEFDLIKIASCLQVEKRECHIIVM